MTHTADNPTTPSSGELSSAAPLGATDGGDGAAASGQAGQTGRLHAVIGEFADVTSAVHAAERVRDAGWVEWDLHSPFPIHGIQKRMGLPKTFLPWLAFGGGCTGFFAGLILVWWTNASTIDGVPTFLQGYQYLISGKPIFSLPANIPIIFETTVLLAAFATVFGMFGLNRLPMLYNPLLKSERFARATNDRFFIVLSATDPNFDQAASRRLLESTGAVAIEDIYD